MKNKILFISLILIFILGKNCYSQKFGMGLSAIFNPQTESYGAGLRAEIVKNRISFVPQIAYYPSFNKISELYAGASLQLTMFYIKNMAFYALANGAYNGWLNYSTSIMKDAQFSNWDGEIGAGLTTRGCLRPFIEYRYNFKWKETNLRVGVMYFFKCNKNRGRKKRKSMTCPAYN